MQPVIDYEQILKAKCPTIFKTQSTMTKTEKKLVDVCELINAYFQMTQANVKAAIESQLKEQTKEIIDDITNKKKKVKQEA